MYPQRINTMVLKVMGMKLPDKRAAIINWFQWKLSNLEVPTDRKHIKVFCLYGKACHQNPLPKLDAEKIFSFRHLSCRCWPSLLKITQWNFTVLSHSLPEISFYSYAFHTWAVITSIPYTFHVHTLYYKNKHLSSAILLHHDIQDT
jgi:hypothetical protein